MMAVQQKDSKFTMPKEALMPQEEMLEVIKKQKKLVIGIPHEDHKLECRIPLTPEAVEILVGNGHEVLIEINAGKAANYEDNEYSEKGAQIVDKKDVILKSDIVLKISAPTLEELELYKDQQIVISTLHIPSQPREFFEVLIAKKLTAIAFEKIKDENNNYPVTQSMSAISGNTAVLIAAEYLSNQRGGKGVMLGGISGITPTEVVILGAGTAAEYAVRAAMGLGATVKVFDHSVHRLACLQNNLGLRLHTSVFHPRVLKKSLMSADVLIGAVPEVEKGYKFLVTEDMVSIMKKGSVIIDMSIDQGGCVETSICRTQQNPVYTKNGVVHYCIPNIPSRVSRTASIAISNVFLPLLIDMGAAGGLTKKLKEDAGLRHGVYMFNGILTDEYIGKLFGLPSRDINLFIAAF